MLELPLVKGHLFHDVLEASLDLSDVALVECSRADLKLQAVDTERVAIVALLFPAEDFPGYICDEYISMGIPIRDLVKAILCGDKDAISLKVGNENDTVTLSFVPPEKSTAAYDLLIMDAEIPRFELPDWQDLKSKYQAFVKMPSVEFRRICKYLSNFRDEDGGISVTDKGLKFFAKGKSRRVNIKPEEDTTTFEINMQDPVTLTFNLKYLNTFAKVFTLSDQVKLCLSKTHLMVECKIGQKGHISCFLAPKMETEFQREEEEKDTQKEDARCFLAPKMETEFQGEEEEKDTQKEDARCFPAPKMETEFQGEEEKDTQKEDANANKKKKRKRPKRIPKFCLK